MFSGGGFLLLQDAQTVITEVKQFSFCLAPDSEDHARLPGCVLPWQQLVQFATFLLFVSISSWDGWYVLLQDDSLLLLLLLLLQQPHLCNTWCTTFPTLIKGLCTFILLVLWSLKNTLIGHVKQTAEGNKRCIQRRLHVSQGMSPAEAHLWLSLRRVHVFNGGPSCEPAYK